MGLFMSSMGKEMPRAQMLSFAMRALYHQFIQKDIKDFVDFHKAILDIFSTLNSALPGKHFDVPPLKEVEECYIYWQSVNESEKKPLFIHFMTKNVTLSKLDNTTLITGLVTPPAAMAAKRAGEQVPQLKLIKTIPDVLFVPSATVLALISIKVARNFFLKLLAS